MTIRILGAISILGVLFLCFTALISCSQPVEKTAEGKGIPPPPFMKPPATPPPGKPIIQAFDVSPDIIRKHLDQASTLHWNVRDADSVFITNVGYVPPMGSMAIKPNQSGLYILTAVNVNGSVSISKKLTVEP
jgi:hypothetical protein